MALKQVKCNKDGSAPKGSVKVKRGKRSLCMIREPGKK
jgi:hypothetical protein